MTIAKTLRGKIFTFETKAGLFSKDSVDHGSQMLIEHMDVKDGNMVVDLGCGYGPIGLVAATMTPLGKVYLVDSDIRAVKHAILNAEINGIKNVEILASDGFEELAEDIKFDMVLSNPPSHLPKEVIIEFVEKSRERLNNNGKLCFVTEKRIKPMIRREFERVFNNYQAVAENSLYVVSVTNQIGNN